MTDNGFITWLIMSISRICVPWETQEYFSNILVKIFPFASQNPSLETSRIFSISKKFFWSQQLSTALLVLLSEIATKKTPNKSICCRCYCLYGNLKPGNNFRVQWYGSQHWYKIEIQEEYVSLNCIFILQTF